MNYTVLYSTTLVVSFILTLIFLLYHSRYWNPLTHVPLQMIYFLNMASSLLCVAWVFLDGKPALAPVNYIVNIIEFNCLGFSSFFWLRYCLRHIDIPALKTRTAFLLTLLPITAVMLLIVTTPLTHWLFYIDEGGCFHRGKFYFFQLTAYVYLLVSSVLCLAYRKRATNSSQRRLIRVLALFPLPPFFFGSIQLVSPSGMAPTLQFSVLISLILVFVNELDQKITRDSLTQLKNRYEFEHVLQNRLRSFQENENRLFVLLCDIDDFKSINDNYGHQQGDIALRIMGNVLARAEQKYHAVCARMSGDEFLCLLETGSSDTVADFQSYLEQRLRDTSANLPYTLTLSIGVAEYDGARNLMDFLNEADRKMYEQKKKRKSNAAGDTALAAAPL